MITEQNILDAIKDARAGGYAGHRYDQHSWCGSACCVLGLARLRAGMPEVWRGPQPGEIEDTPRNRMLAMLMPIPDSDVLDLMESVRPDGSLEWDGVLNLPNLTSLRAGMTLRAGRDIYLNRLTSLPAGVTLSAGTCIYMGSLTRLSAGVNISAGWRIWITALTHLEPGAVLPHNAVAPNFRKNYR